MANRKLLRKNLVQFAEDAQNLTFREACPFEERFAVQGEHQVRNVRLRQGFGQLATVHDSEMLSLTCQDPGKPRAGWGVFRRLDGGIVNSGVMSRVR